MVFAENYVCMPLEEVQSGYWSQNGVTLHLIVVYYQVNNNELAHQSMVQCSCVGRKETQLDYCNITQGDSSIAKAGSPLPQLSHVHYWTDSRTSQYRNRTMFSVPNGTTLRRGTTKGPATELVGLQTYG